MIKTTATCEFDGGNFASDYACQISQPSVVSIVQTTSVTKLPHLLSNQTGHLPDGPAIAAKPGNCAPQCSLSPLPRSQPHKRGFPVQPSDHGKSHLSRSHRYSARSRQANNQMDLSQRNHLYPQCSPSPLQRSQPYKRGFPVQPSDHGKSQYQKEKEREELSQRQQFANATVEVWYPIMHIKSIRLQIYQLCKQGLGLTCHTY